MYRSVAATFSLSFALLFSPTVASACAVTHPLSEATLAQDEEREGRAWAHAPLVYLATITGTGSHYDAFELTPSLILKGGPEVPVMTVQPVAGRGMCTNYHGLNAEEGATVGDEFIVYVMSEPASEGGLYVVSARMVRDLATRVALADARKGRR